jgi:hypothetical protein
MTTSDYFKQRMAEIRRSPKLRRPKRKRAKPKVKFVPERIATNRICVSLNEAANLTGLSASSVKKLLVAAGMPIRKHGRTTLIMVDDLECAARGHKRTDCAPVDAFDNALRDVMEYVRTLPLDRNHINVPHAKERRG